MKKQLLLGSLLLAAVSAFPQQGRTKPAGQVDVAEKYHQKMLRTMKEPSASTLNNNSVATNPQPEASMSAAPTGTWNLIAGSRNLYGVLVSEQRPLQYNSALNTVSYIHRCSNTYSGSPVDNTGVIVAEISTDWGATWDSTALWSDANQGRYPGGGIYNPAGNTNINNAYVVAAGPTTNGSGWQGSFFASKQLGTANYNSTASAAPGAMQFINNSAPLTNTAVGKVDFPRYCFTATNDGKMRSVGRIVNDINNTSSNAGYGYRGINMVKGTYNAGVFDWVGDSIMFNGVVYMNTAGTAGSTSDDYFMATGSPMLAFNEAGTHGYAFIIGVRNSPANANSSGYQPIVWRTSDGGGSWSLMPGIDFASPTFSNVIKHLYAVPENTTKTIPLFNASEGIGAVVDANNKLHLVMTVVASSREEQDSVGYSFTNTLSVNSSTATYSWGHVPGDRPYIYDFMLDGATSTWDYMVVDSMSSEAPSGTSGEGGFSENPFDEDAGAKQVSDARIQASRTVDGKFVVISWAESDTNFTNSGVKYNIIPDIKVRCIDVQNGGGSGNYFLSPTELNISKLGTNLQVEKKAVMHYMTPVSGAMAIGTNPTKTSTITTGFTITHSQGPGAQPGTIFAGLTSNAHWFCAPKMDFNLAVVGVKENALESVNSAVIYPNPASGNAVLSIDMVDNANVSIDVYSTVGQLVKSSKTTAQVGENTINFDLSNLATGIYMVNVKVGNAVSTKKLIVE
ncbi:MAG: BNR/Asp-box repeat protein [Bacteroidetes bacterium]|jgi:hypothetical protein|nr:BNR/Asp-box repeat protein [Bacteroidota bacterium]